MPPQDQRSLIAQQLLPPRTQGLLGRDEQSPQAPQAQSLLGGGEAPPQPAPPQPQGGGGVGGALSELFGGADDPRLSAEANKRASRAARIQAGLATVLAADTKSFGGALATGALVGQQAGAAGRGQALSQLRAQQVRELSAGFDLTTPQGIVDAKTALLPLIATGDTGALAAGNSLDSLLKASGAGTRQIDISESGGVRIGRDRITGEILWKEPVDQSPAERRKEVREISKGKREARALIADDFRSDFTARQVPKLAISARVAAAAIQDDNAVSDQSLVNALSQLVDPSVVREGEFNRLAGAGGALAKARGLRDRFLKGELPAGVRKQIIREIQKMVEIHRKVFRINVIERLQRRAKLDGLTEDEVSFMFPDPFAEVNLTGPGEINLNNTQGGALDAYLPSASDSTGTN